MDALVFSGMPLIFHQLAEYSPAGLCLVSGDELRVKWANPAYGDFFDPPRYDLSGLLLSDFIPNFSTSGLESIFRNVAATGERYTSSQYCYEGHARGVTYWKWSLTAISAAPECIPDLMISALEVTEIVTLQRALLEQALAQHQEQHLYHSLLSATPDFNYLLNLQGQFIYANEAMINFFALADDIVGKTFYEIGYPPGLARRMDDALQDVISNKKNVRTESAFSPDAGEWRIHDNIFAPILNAQGEITSIAGSTRNVTERKSAEQELRASEEKFKLLANTIPQLVWMATADGWVYWYNERWYEYTGTTLQDVKGWGWQSVHDPQRLPEVLEKWKVSLASGEPFELSFPLKGADGQFRPFLTRSMPLKNALGEVLGWFGSSTDISVQEHLVEERLQSQLMQTLSQRLSEVQEDERKQLSRELHDQVGQKLTALNINLNIMLEHMSAESSRKLSVRVNDSISLVEETAACIENILTELRPPMLDDYGLISALRWYGTLFHKRFGVKVRVIGPHAAPRLDLAHESGLFRIAQEALNNVAKHAQAQNVVISLWFRKGETQLTISDDGIGFTKKLLKHPSKKSRRGVLTMQERALALGGHFSIISMPGEGTQVNVKLVHAGAGGGGK